MEEMVWEPLREALDSPPETTVAQSRQRVRLWFKQTAPLIRWDVIESPLGLLYFAASAHGLCSVNFGVSQDFFLSTLDPLARIERDPAALASVAAQLHEYFAGLRRHFDLLVDLDRLRPFQRGVLQITRGIPAGTIWTYSQVAHAIGKPQASRAVGQALGHNPIPIVIPCHRVIASNGHLGGYSGSGGLESKRLLLRLEGAAIGA